MQMSDAQFERDELGFPVITEGTDPWQDHWDEHMRVLRTQLSNKANRGPDELISLAGVFASKFAATSSGIMTKAQNNLVTISMLATGDTDLVSGDIVLALPVGFRNPYINFPVCLTTTGGVLQIVGRISADSAGSALSITIPAGVTIPANTKMIRAIFSYIATA